MRKEYLFKNISICVSTLLLTSSALFAQKTEAPKKLDSVTVIGKASSDYVSVEKPSIIRNNISLEETPKSVQIFNHDFITDFQPQSINDIITMSSSTMYLGDDHGRQNMFAIRGFQEFLS